MGENVNLRQFKARAWASPWSLCGGRDLLFLLHPFKKEIFSVIIFTILTWEFDVKPFLINAESFKFALAIQSLP